jgi:hypothetical protein
MVSLILREILGYSLETSHTCLFPFYLTLSLKQHHWIIQDQESFVKICKRYVYVQGHSNESEIFNMDMPSLSIIWISYNRYPAFECWPAWVVSGPTELIYLAHFVTCRRRINKAVNLNCTTCNDCRLCPTSRTIMYMTTGVTTFWRFLDLRKCDCLFTRPLHTMASTSM